MLIMGIQNTEFYADFKSAEKVVKKYRENSYRRKGYHCEQKFSAFSF
jgi:hypothetical protein